MSAHTPGSWDFVPGIGVINSGSPDHHYIARMWSKGPNPAADAHVLAAAPDLLVALVELLAARTETSEKMARSAIAKARGTTT